MIDRWLLRVAAAGLILLGIWFLGRDVADWLVWRRDVTQAVQQLLQRTAPSLPTGADPRR